MTKSKQTTESSPVAGHTPGKWEVATHGTTPGNTSIEVQTESGLPIAVMAYTGRAEENARLIAAAPALLAALERVSAILAKSENPIPEGDDGTILSIGRGNAQQAFNQARAAISLAKGGDK